MLQHEHKLWVNKIDKTKQLFAKVLENSNTAFNWKYVISVFYQVVQKNYLGEVEQ